MLTTAIGIVVVVIAEVHPGGGRGGGARHPRAMLMGPTGRIAPLLLAVSPRVAETIALRSSWGEDRKTKPSATTHVERGDQARVICSKR